jgi:membrane protein DedA with SNARE-associated domain
MNYITFLAATLVGAYLWCTLLIGAGYLFGHEWPLISQYVRQSLPYFLLAGLLGMVLYLLVSRKVLKLAWARIRNDD